MHRPYLKYALFAAVTVLTLSCKTTAPEGMTEPTLVQHLYPKGQHCDEGIIEDGLAVTLGPGEANRVDTTEFWWERDGSLNFISDSARVVVYIPENHNGTMVMSIPGGGYGELQYRSEGSNAAKILTAKGYAVAILCYRLPTRIHSIPLTDAQNALRFLRHHAAEWGIKRIGVMGMSAGGHLASSVSTLYTDSITRPDFTILLYAPITSDEPLRTRGSFKTLTGNDPELMERYSAEKHVTADTPPAIIFHSADDRGVKPGNSICYYQALREAGVQAELHIFPMGGHGWGFNTLETAGYDKLGPCREVFNTALFTFLESLETPKESSD